LVLVALILAGASCASEAPRADRGQLDLSRWDFGAQGPARLDGQWEMWWGRELPSPEGPGSAGYDLAQLPGYWSTGDKSPYPADGAVTYHLRLSLPPGQGPWSLSLPDVACAWRLRIDGQVVAEQGGASQDPNLYRALVRPRVVALPPSQDRVDLTLFVVNTSDRAGGIRDSILVGPSTDLDRRYLLSQIDASFFVGGLFVMALFNFIIFFLQRQKGANLWLALFTTFIALRSVFTGPRIVHDLWPTLSFDLVAQTVFLCILGAVSSFVFYMKKLFPQWWPSRIFIPFLFYTGLFALLLFFLPVQVYSEAFFRFYDLPMALVTVVFLGIAWWATRQKHEDGPLVFFGMLFLLSGALNDILYQMMPLPQGDILGRFLFIFLVFNTFLLSRQLSKDYALTVKQAEELRRLDQMKDEFLARVTHELRTPLNGMLGILDAFKMGDFGALPDRQAYHVGLLESSGRRLLTMVNSILDFSHLRKHQLVSEPRPIALRQTVDFLLPSFYPLVKPGVALINRVSDQLPAALGDEVKLQQILHHLLKNALAHTEWGTVAVEAEVRDLQVLILVRDTGKGIPAAKLAQLFSPFHQVAEVDTRETGGLGLGLALSRQLVQQMGGRLELVSVENNGTTAQIWLPLCPPSKLQYFQAQRLDRVFHWEEGTAGPGPTAGPAPEAPAGPAPEPDAPLVLIVDDEPVNLLVLRTFLRRSGYRVIEATSGPQALEAVTAQLVDLIILDVMMPGMSGYEVCAKVRERFSPARLPIMLLTAKNQVEDLLQGYQCGAGDFVTKPFQRDELKVRMELHLQVSKAARAGVAVPNKA